MARTNQSQFTIALLQGLLRTITPVTGDELRKFRAGKIAHFKIPRNYKFVDEFPMTVTEKIQKFKMREISIEEMGLKK